MPLHSQTYSIFIINKISTHMKQKAIVIIIALISVTAISAQEWHTDFTNAKTIAKEEKKPIVLVFQGSDWCGPCIKLDREIWSTDTFKNYAADHYVMLQADFPRRKKNSLPESQAKANAQLAERYNTTGVFPFVVILDHEGNVLGETSYKKMTPEDYIKELNSLIK